MDTLLTQLGTFGCLKQTRVLMMLVVFIGFIGLSPCLLKAAVSGEPQPSESAPSVPATTAKPVEAGTANETVAPKRLNPVQGYGQLLYDDLADRLGLTDAQRLEVQRIMTERAQALANAAKEDVAEQEKIIAGSEQKLEQVLTPEQKRIWPKVFEQKHIRFNFKFQNWEQVLQWFADMVGKMLVMDAPPPGTFDYSSQEEFSPTEALDLLNARLLLKGYTLLHKDRMLMLVNLKRDKLSPQMLPKIDESMMEDRGKFEFVALSVPLEGRDVAVVEKEIAPFLGTYSSVIALPGALLIVDTIANLKSILPIIKAVPLPKKPEPPAPPAPVPPSEWEGYKITNADPVEVEGALSKFLSLQGYRSGDTLWYFVPAAQHAAIKLTIAMIEKTVGQREKPVLESYSLEGLIDTSPARLWYQAKMQAYGYRTDPSSNFGEGIVQLIKQVVPDAVVAPTQVSNKLLVFAIPADQTKIKELFDKLRTGPAPEETPSVKIYTFSDPERVLGLTSELETSLKLLLPTAQYTYDPGKGQMLVVAIPREHEIIAETLKVIETETLPDEDKVLVAYPITKRESTRFTQLFNQIKSTPEFLGVIDLSDPKSNQLTVWATPRQHERIKTLLKEVRESTGVSGTDSNGLTGLDGSKGSQESSSTTFAVIPLRNALPYAVREIITNMVPGVEVSIDTASNSIYVYGSAAMIGKVQEVVQQVDSELDKTVLFIPVVREISSDVQSMISTAAPKATVLMDKKNMRVLVFGPKSSVLEVEKIVRENAASDAKTQDTMQAFYVKRELTEELLDFVRRTYPRAEIRFNKELRQVVVSAPENEQVLIAKQIIEAESLLPPEEETRFYMLDRPVTENLLTLIRETTRDAGQIGEIRRDWDNPKMLIVRARPNVQSRIQEILKNVDEVLPLIGPNTLRSFSVTPDLRRRFDTVLDQFKKEHGDVRVLEEDRKDILTIWANEEQLNLIGQLIEQLGKEVMPDVREKRIIHQLQYVSFETVKSLLEDVYPGTKITEDKAGNRIIVRVRPEFYEGTKELIEQLDSRDPEQARRYYKSYDLNGFSTYDSQGNYYSPFYFIADMEKLAPNAKITFDRYSQQMIVWGTAEEQKIISDAVGQLQKDTDKTKRFDRFLLRRIQPSYIISMINRLFPTLQPIYDSGTQAILVEGSPNQLQQIDDLIDRLDPAEPGPTDPIIQFYQLKTKPDDTLITTLKSLVPTAQIVPDRDNKQLMVLAKPDDQVIVERNMKSILETFIQPEEPMLFIYPVSGDQRKLLESFLTAASSELKDVKILADTVPGQISIWARPSEQELIAAILLQIQTSQGKTLGLKLRVFPLDVVDPTTARDVISTMHPEVKLLAGSATDSQKNRLLVWATESNLEDVAATLKEIDVANTDESQPRFQAFNVDGLRFDSASLRNNVITRIVADLQLLVPNARITPSADYFRIIVFGTLKELKIVETALKSIGYTNSPDDQPTAQVFVINNMDVELISKLLSTTIPNVSISPDPKNGNIVVYARPREMQEIAKTINDLDKSNLNTKIPITYTILGMKSETVLQSIKEVYPGLKVSEDAKAGRLIVWATPEEQVRIGDLVRQINSEDEDESAERVYAYPITRLYYGTAIQIITELFPSAQVFSNPLTDKLIIKARVRDHKAIKELLEKIQTKDDQYRVQIRFYPIGNADPSTMEALLRTLLKGAMSLTPYDVQYDVLFRTGYTGDVPDMSTYDYTFDPASVYNRSGRPYFRIDAGTQTAIVVAMEEDQKRVEPAITEFVALAQEAGEPRAGFFTISEVYVYTLLPTLQKIAPSCRIIQGATSHDFVAFGIEAELKKIENFVEELNNSGGPDQRREMILLQMPPNAKQSRERIVQMLRYLYPQMFSSDRPPVEGPEPGQIVVWGRAFQKEPLQQLIDEVCQTLPDDQQTIYKVYPVYNANLNVVITWLYEIFPNAEFAPNTAEVDPYTGIPLPQRALLVLATPIEQAEIEKALAEIDQGIPESERAYVRIHTLTDITPAYYYLYFFRNVVPNARFSSTADTNELIAYANKQDQERIQELVDELNKKGPSENKRQFGILTVPPGTRYNRTVLVQILTGFFPELYPALGMEPNQIMVFGKKFQNERAQELVDKVCTQLPEEEQIKPKWYSVKNMRAPELVQWLSTIYPNVKIVLDSRSDERNGQGIIVDASPLEHLQIEKTIAELDVPVPEDMRPIVRLYDIDTTQSNFSNTYYAVYYNFPTPQIVSIIPSIDQGTIAITAIPETQERIAEFLKNLEDERQARQPYLETYNLKRLNYLQVAPLLSQVAPTAQILQGATPDVLFVWAIPQLQDAIAESIEKLETADLNREQLSKEGLLPVYKVYRIYSKNAPTLAILLHPEFPGAIFFATTAEDLVVWASPPVQEQVALAVGVIADAYPEPYVKTHFFKYIAPSEAFSQLTQIFAPSDAVFSISPITRELTVRATERYHELVEKSISKIDVPTPEESRRYAVAYDFSDFNVTTALPYFSSQLPIEVPGVLVLPNYLPTQVVVVGRKIDHEKIKQIVEQMKTENPLHAFSVQNYVLKTATPTQVVPLLRSLTPNATFTVGTDPHLVIVYANQRDHSLLKETVDAMNEHGFSLLIPRTYRFQRVTLPVATQMILGMFPDAEVFPDTAGELLMVKATVEQHVKIAQAMNELDATDPKTQVSIQVYNVGRVDMDSLTTTLNRLSTLRPGLVVTRNYYTSDYYGSQYPTGTISVLGTPDDQRLIKGMLEYIQDEALNKNGMEIRRYSLKGRTSYSYFGLIWQIMEFRNMTFNYIFDQSSNDLFVYARPQEHELIAEIFDMTKPTAKYMQIFQIQSLDVESVQTALTELFAEDGWYNRPSYNVDFNSNTLFMRGTIEQLERVRNLLIQMGETQLIRMQDRPIPLNQAVSSTSSTGLPDSTRWTGSTGLVETRSSGTDSVDRGTVGAGSVETPGSTDWSGRGQSGYNLTGNDLTGANTSENKLGSTGYDSLMQQGGDVDAGVLSGETKNIRTFRLQGNMTQTLQELEKNWPKVRDNTLIIRKEGDPLMQDKGEKKEKQEPNNSKEGKEKGPATEKGSITEKSSVIGKEVVTGSVFFNVRDSVVKEETTGTPSEDVAIIEPIEANGQVDSATPSIYLIYNSDGTVTITSSDREALDALEVQLKALTNRVIYEGRDYTIFSVRNINATVVAQKLQIYLRDRITPRTQPQNPYRRGYWGYSTPTSSRRTLEITPDTAENAIMVRGSKKDREEAGRMIEILDVSQLRDKAVVVKPINVPLENEQNTVILQQVLEVFQGQIQSTTLPGGGRPRISLNRTSNSLDIFAPQPLAGEIEAYIKELDEAVPLRQSQRVHVIRPTNTNSATIQQAIRAIQNSALQKYQLANPGFGYSGWGYPGYNSSFGRGYNR
ncbi:MAG: secretin N-terminal domain-containing protein [Thermoguttaceae bacterium]